MAKGLNTGGRAPKRKTLGRVTSLAKFVPHRGGPRKVAKGTANGRRPSGIRL